MQNTNTTHDLFIATAQAEFMQAAITELKRLDPQVRSIEELAPEIMLCTTPAHVELIKRIKNHQPTFLRHITAVQTIVDLNNTEQDLGSIAIATIQLPEIRLLEKGVRFAVQTRLVQTDKRLGERAYSSGQINKSLAEGLAEETEALEHIKKPEVIISLLCTMNTCYIGISTAQDNLSSWPGGARHYAQGDEQISRAEFKLLEALEVFGIALPNHGQALDLGAAPGGWTRLLLDAGLYVVAVDPARLDTRLIGKKGLQHYKGYAEDFITDAVHKKKQFSLIVNDMRMDAREAARLLVQATTCLRPEGIVISTLKLPHATQTIDPLRNLKDALAILQHSYGIIQAHQLFHNRQEITVVAAQPVRVKVLH